MSNVLNDLIAGAKKEHAEVGTALVKAAKHARTAGKFLCEAQEKFWSDDPKGKWGEWFAANVPIPYASAALYMRVHREWANVEAVLGAEADDVSLCFIRRLLTKPKSSTSTPTGPVVGTMPEQAESAPVTPNVPPVGPETKIDLDTILTTPDFPPKYVEPTNPQETIDGIVSFLQILEQLLHDLGPDEKPKVKKLLRDVQRRVEALIDAM
jgi:hypothetical protein